MGFEDFIGMLLHAGITIMIPLSAIYFVCAYARELWVFFTRREDYDGLKKSSMTAGDMPGGPELSTGQRLIFGYPFFIGFSGLFTFLIVRGLLDGSWPFIN